MKKEGEDLKNSAQQDKQKDKQNQSGQQQGEKENEKPKDEGKSKMNTRQLSKEDRARMVKERDERVEEIFEKFLTEKTSEIVKQVEFRKKLLTFNETKIGTHCESRYNDCGPGGMCSDAKCVARPEERRGPPEGGGRICPQVCIPMWEMRDNKCEFNQCGSGCGAGSEILFTSNRNDAVAFPPG